MPAGAACPPTLAGLSAGESGLDAAYESAAAAVEGLEVAIVEIRQAEQKAQTERASLAARLDGLALGLDRKDASAALLAAAENSRRTLIVVGNRGRGAERGALGSVPRQVAQDAASDVIVIQTEDVSGLTGSVSVVERSAL